MKRLIFLLTIAAALIFADLTLSHAQNNDISLKLDNHSMLIDGTANIRDWDSEVKKIDAEVVLKEFDLSDLSSLTAEHFKTLKLNMPVSDIESDSRRLTRNLQDYLKGDDHPYIKFNLKSIENVEAEDNNSAVVTAIGVINAAGVDHEVTMTVNASVNDGTVTFSGTQDLLMTDFGIDPPTAVMGTVRARDEIQIIYSLTFSVN